MNPRVVILSAGASSRLGEPKALAQIGGRRVLDWMLSAALRSFPEDAIPMVVTGAHHAELSGFLKEAAGRTSNALRSEIAYNSRWSDGRTTGLQLAAERNLNADLLIWPADVPLVSAGTLRALAQEWGRIGSPPHGWLAPSVEGVPPSTAAPKAAIPELAAKARFGHPIVVGHELLRSAGGMQADAPLRQLRGTARPLAALGVDDLAVLDDLDTPADLERLRRRMKKLDPMGDDFEE